MTMAPIINAMNRNAPACSMLGCPVDPVEVGTGFALLFISSDETGKPAGANDNENDDEGSEEAESD